MNVSKKLALGAMGGALALTLALGGVTAFAQESESTTPSVAMGVEPSGLFAPGNHLGGRGGVADEYLADALGITVEELDAAQVEARAAMLADDVAAGTITQEQADLMTARNVVESYVDKEALAAETEGLDRTAASAARRAAYEAVIAEALADGAITQAQADTLRAEPTGRGFGGRGGRGGSGFTPDGQHRPRLQRIARRNPEFNLAPIQRAAIIMAALCFTVIALSPKNTVTISFLIFIPYHHDDFGLNIHLTHVVR